MRHDELMHLAIGGRPGQHRQQTEHQDLRQGIQFSFRPPVVFDVRKNLQQCRLPQKWSLMKMSLHEAQWWLGKFGQIDKWKICLRAARMPHIRSDNGETS